MAMMVRMTMNPRTRSTNTTNNNKRPAVVLVGWLGCRPRHLRRYSQMYDSIGWGSLVRIGSPKSVIAAMTEGPCADSDSDDQSTTTTTTATTQSSEMKHLAIHTLRELHNNQTPYFIFHVFSNNGCFFWEWIRFLLFGQQHSSLLSDDDDDDDDANEEVHGTFYPSIQEGAQAQDHQQLKLPSSPKRNACQIEDLVLDECIVVTEGEEGPTPTSSTSPSASNNECPNTENSVVVHHPLIVSQQGENTAELLESNEESNSKSPATKVCNTTNNCIHEAKPEQNVQYDGDKRGGIEVNEYASAADNNNNNTNETGRMEHHSEGERREDADDDVNDSGKFVAIELVSPEKKRAYADDGQSPKSALDHPGTTTTAQQASKFVPNPEDDADDFVVDHHPTTATTTHPTTTEYVRDGMDDSDFVAQQPVPPATFNNSNDVGNNNTANSTNRMQQQQPPPPPPGPYYHHGTPTPSYYDPHSGYPRHHPSPHQSPHNPSPRNPSPRNPPPPSMPHQQRQHPYSPSPSRPARPPPPRPHYGHDTPPPRPPSYYDSSPQTDNTRVDYNNYQTSPVLSGYPTQQQQQQQQPADGKSGTAIRRRKFSGIIRSRKDIV
mmetsp:Transcript_20052/g.37754  ORF Transcript_20052/g.37754 Transcript_20052/m.37754 type:complete len:605 (-) Transcript_20052:2773-4587(-)